MNGTAIPSCWMIWMTVSCLIHVKEHSSHHIAMCRLDCRQPFGRKKRVYKATPGICQRKVDQGVVSERRCALLCSWKAVFQRHDDKGGRRPLSDGANSLERHCQRPSTSGTAHRTKPKLILRDIWRKHWRKNVQSVQMLSQRQLCKSPYRCAMQYSTNATCIED